MEVETGIIATILCPMCGIAFIPRLGNVCEACTLARTDITIGITKDTIVSFCRFCHRYMQPPWIHCERESKELLALLLKKIKGLGRAKIINAVFIWTEPHAKRIKLKITIQKDLNESSKVEQTFVVEFTELHMQCDDCKKEFTPHNWGAVVQVRQHVNHKKTFFFLEQMLLKSSSLDKVIKVAEEEDGLDFFFKTSTHAQRLLDFLNTKFPLTVKLSKQLISQDDHSNTFNYKYGFSVELPRICKNDLVIITKKLAKELGGCSQLLLCWKVSQSISLVDLQTFNYVTLSSAQYFHHEKDFVMLPLHRYKTLYTLVDSEPVDFSQNKQIKSSLHKLRSHIFHYTFHKTDGWDLMTAKGALGPIPADSQIEGFDLATICHTEELDTLKGYSPVALVRKVRERKNRTRAFKLKKLEEEGIMVEEKDPTRGRKKIRQDKEEEKDLEDFLDDIEADADMRKDIHLYKNKEAFQRLSKQEQKEILGEIELCELLDEMRLKEAAPETQPNEDSEAIDELISKLKKVQVERE